MSTSAATLRTWFDAGVAQGATHMIVVCDTFNWSDSRVYVTPAQNVREEAKKYDGPNMNKLMEIYDLRLDREMQMSEVRALHY